MMMGGPPQAGLKPGGGMPSILATDFVKLVTNMIEQHRAEYGAKLFDKFVSPEEIADLMSAAKAANQEQAEKLEALKKELAALKAGLENKMHQALKSDELKKAKDFEKLIGNLFKYGTILVIVVLVIGTALVGFGVMKMPSVTPVRSQPASSSASSSASSTLSLAPAGAVKPCPVAGDVKGLEVFRYLEKVMKSSPPAAGVAVKYVAGDQVTYLNVVYCPVTANGFTGFYVKK